MPDSAVEIGYPYNFTPSAQREDTSTTLDALIASYTPWGYWKLNEASGAPQDSSGNARHGSVSIAPSYSQAPITSKVGNSMRLDGARLIFPAPWARLGNNTNVWTIGGLFYLENEVGSGSPAQSVQGSPFLGQTSNPYYSASDFFVAVQLLYTAGIIIRSGGYAGGSQFPFQANQPMSVFVMGSSVPGLTFTIEMYINGVKLGQSMRGAAGAGFSTEFQVGRSHDPNAPFPAMRASNICCWASELTPRNIIDITELMMSKAAYTTAYKP